MQGFSSVIKNSWRLLIAYLITWKTKDPDMDHEGIQEETIYIYNITGRWERNETNTVISIFQHK